MLLSENSGKSLKVVVRSARCEAMNSSRCLSVARLAAASLDPTPKKARSMAPAHSWARFSRRDSWRVSSTDWPKAE
ncbi:hypothetical protein D3C78_1117270 [compost metagenome]